MLPLEVFAKSVNCETQSTSPSISFTLDFHGCPSGPSNALSERLHVQPVNYRDCMAVVDD